MNLFRHLPPSLLLFTVLPSTAGEAKFNEITAAPSNGDWDFSISAGPSWRRIGDVQISGGSRSGGLVLPSLIGGDSLVTPDIGNSDAYDNRTYNDGYVGQDSGTAGDGQTWNWGYDDAGQVQGDQIAFTATGYQTVFSETRSDLTAGSARNRDLEGLAPHLQFDARSPLRLGPFRVGFSAGLDYVKSDQSLSFSSFSSTQTLDNYRLDYVDTYDLNGIVAPQAPYQGSDNGPGPVIGNLPSSSEMTQVFTGSETASFSNYVRSTFDLSALSITVGPTLTFEKRRFDFTVGAGLSLNIYDWDASQKERLSATTSSGISTYAKWSDRESGIKLRPGFYLQGEAAYRLTEMVGIAAFTRFDIAKDFTVSTGPTDYEIDSSGATMGLMLRYTWSDK